MYLGNSFFESALFQTTGQDHQIKDALPVSGGDINHAVRLVTNHDTFFFKYNSTDVGDLFEKEALGLRLLSSTKTLPVPTVYGTGTASTYHFLLMEYLPKQAPGLSFWKDFGSSLAEMHQHTQSQFGLDHDNHIGKLPQKNTLSDSWIDFFINNRLEVQLGLAIYNGHVDQPYAENFRKLYAQLPGLLPDEPPALLHGDLWSGNFMCGPGSQAWIYDPAVYYGHREMELAFTRLFGGFDHQFYDSYHEAYPLEPGLEERTEIYNLYPLLVHVNLFGTSYLSGINRTLRRFL